MSDIQLAKLLGMTPQNLRATYKKSADPTKRRVYEIMRLGAEAWLQKERRKEKNSALIEFIANLEPLESFAAIDDSVSYVNELRKSRDVADFH